MVYIDTLYERVADAGTGMEHKIYLGDYAVYNLGGSDAGLNYLHKDRLGSVVALSEINNLFKYTASRHFDPFGKPREVELSASNDPNHDLNGEGVTARGFTGHEHLSSVQLIHMNGRAYDYNLGRFLSVDPFIQFPENSQSLNPYSYIMNNPMSGVDPTGYAMEEVVRKFAYTPTGSHIARSVTVTATQSTNGGPATVTVERGTNATSGDVTVISRAVRSTIRGAGGSVVNLMSQQSADGTSVSSLGFGGSDIDSESTLAANDFSFTPPFAQEINALKSASKESGLDVAYKESVESGVELVFGAMDAATAFQKTQEFESVLKGMSNSEFSFRGNSVPYWIGQTAFIVAVTETGSGAVTNLLIPWLATQGVNGARAAWLAGSLGTETSAILQEAHVAARAANQVHPAAGFIIKEVPSSVRIPYRIQTTTLPK